MILTMLSIEGTPLIEMFQDETIFSLIYKVETHGQFRHGPDQGGRVLPGPDYPVQNVQKIRVSAVFALLI